MKNILISRREKLLKLFLRIYHIYKMLLEFYYCEKSYGFCPYFIFIFRIIDRILLQRNEFVLKPADFFFDIFWHAKLNFMRRISKEDSTFCNEIILTSSLQGARTTYNRLAIIWQSHHGKISLNFQLFSILLALASNSLFQVEKVEM